MTRHHFHLGKPYAAKLLRVSARAIENAPSIAISLLRLEFEIYWQELHPLKTLRSHGQFACRDLIVGQLLPANRDSGLMAYADALNVQGSVCEPDSWVKLSQQNRWVEIEFGRPSELDLRNAFAKISAFDARAWRIVEFALDQRREWVTPKEAADALQLSESTIRRRVGDFETEFGDRLLRRTSGGHRRICFPLLRCLMDT